jgi:uncharacterized membrane protein
MNKQMFLDELKKGLCGFPQDEIEERLCFYAEIIDDRMEEGLSEEDAVNEIGSVDEIIAQILADIPLTKIVKEKIKPRRRLRALEITLLAVGSPIWLSLLIAAFAVVLSLFVSLWAVIISLWSVFAALGVCVLGGIVAGVGFFVGGYGFTGIVMVAMAIICAGLSIFFFVACKYITKAMVICSKKSVLAIKKLVIGKECML